MKRFSIFIIISAIFSVLLAQSVFGSAYDLYVDKDAGSGGDGSKGDPFDEIGDALEEAGSGDVVYVKNGSYDGGFVVGKNIKIQGESESKVVISGSITMSDGSRLANVTVSGGSTAITVKKDASVTIDECTVKKFSKIGINIVAGNGKLVVKNSDVKDGNGGKGFYIEKGNKIELTSSKVHDNSQEGVDIRDRVDGFIIGNQIYDNGESGIEVILGSADLAIKDNYIGGNGSSGIATQYYEIASKLGGVMIKGNEIEKNKKFGIDCNVPQAGSPSSGYWSKSLDVEENYFEGNKAGRINSKCKLVEADEGDGGEEYDEGAQTVENGTEEKDVESDEEQQAEKEKAEQELKRQQEQNALLQEELNQLQPNLDEQLRKSNEFAQRMQKRNGFWLWLKGPSKKDTLALESEIGALSLQVADLDAMAANTTEESIKQQIRGKREELDQSKSRLAKIAMLDSKRFSLWSWFLRTTSLDLVLQ